MTVSSALGFIPLAQDVYKHWDRPFYETEKTVIETD